MQKIVSKAPPRRGVNSAGRSGQSQRGQFHLRKPYSRSIFWTAEYSTIETLFEKPCQVPYKCSASQRIDLLTRPARATWISVTNQIARVLLLIYQEFRFDQEHTSPVLFAIPKLFRQKTRLCTTPPSTFQTGHNMDLNQTMKKLMQFCISWKRSFQIIHKIMM